jgi:hypothetical protein
MAGRQAWVVVWHSRQGAIHDGGVMWRPKITFFVRVFNAVAVLR